MLQQNLFFTDCHLLIDWMMKICYKMKLMEPITSRQTPDYITQKMAWWISYFQFSSNNNSHCREVPVKLYRKVSWSPLDHARGRHFNNFTVSFRRWLVSGFVNVAHLWFWARFGHELHSIGSTQIYKTQFDWLEHSQWDGWGEGA